MRVIVQTDNTVVATLDGMRLELSQKAGYASLTRPFRSGWGILQGKQTAEKQMLVDFRTFDQAVRLPHAPVMSVRFEEGGKPLSPELFVINAEAGKIWLASEQWRKVRFPLWLLVTYRHFVLHTFQVVMEKDETPVVTITGFIDDLYVANAHDPTDPDASIEGIRILIKDVQWGGATRHATDD